MARTKTKEVQENQVKYILVEKDSKEFISIFNTKEEVITSTNSLIPSVNEELEENIPLVKTFEETKELRENYFNEGILEVNTEKANPIITLSEQAIKFNTKWTGRTKREEHKSYYNFNIKPLYFVDEEYSICFQVSCSLMCPSGISDNGIKHVKQITVCKYAFIYPKKLVEFLVRGCLIGSREGTKVVEFVEF